MQGEIKMRIKLGNFGSIVYYIGLVGAKKELFILFYFFSRFLKKSLPFKGKLMGSFHHKSTSINLAAEQICCTIYSHCLMILYTAMSMHQLVFSSSSEAFFFVGREISPF